ncbi:hypothetical protein AV530_010001 [Patagioenas fasciata monilis]|uniref:Uncharacterized protein n=1 Tax=Patagioenas fasciata monilis TaxID=372326 RepID=A0A1V4KCI3_PATFA|nr:hypothetical protein AV530_010001 [Patagioenas fasciata monilis]
MLQVQPTPFLQRKPKEITKIILLDLEKQSSPAFPSWAVPHASASEYSNIRLLPSRHVTPQCRLQKLQEVNFADINGR